MEKLISDIKQWGIDRGIDKCDPLLQTTKTLEECMELQRAIIRAEKVKTEYLTAPQPGADFEKEPSISYIPPEKITDIKDAIGDIFITLVMIDLQAHGTEDMNLKIKSLHIEGISKPFECTLTILNHIRRMQDRLDESIEGGYFLFLEYIVNELDYLAYLYNLTLKECVEHAYNEIKDRKGSIVDGLWEKEQ